MIYNIYFDVAAIILNVMLLLIIYLRRTYATRSCNFYKGMLWFNLISSSADLISAFTISYAQDYPVFFNYFVNICYLLSHNLTAVLFLLYVIALIRGNLGLRAERIFWGGICAFDFLLVVSSPLTKFVFYFEDGKYCHGPFLWLLYLAAAAILSYAMILFIRHRDVLNVYQMITNITFLSLMMGTVVFQYFFPNVLIESFSCAVAMLMMNVALDNPAIYFYRNSVCFNQTAFETMLGERLGKKERFSVLAFTYDDLSVFRKKLGDSAFDAMIDDTVRICHKNFGQKNVYLLADGCFALDIRGRDDGAEAKKADGLLRRVFSADGVSFALTPHFCVFTHPGCAETVGEVTDMISYMLFEGYRSSGEHLARIDEEQLAAERREEQIVHLLRSAVTDDGFDVYYQPIYDRETGSFDSVEALVRLKASDLGFVSPDEFIPIAEKNGMILEIGELVFEKACRFWKESLAGLGIRYIEINLSKIQLLRPEAAERLVTICSEYGVDPSGINLEITETFGADETEFRIISESIRRLCERGFTFSLDDYGSGFANASYLADMPFRFIKIDKGILWSAMKDKPHDIVLESTVRLIYDLGRGCIAEGVETEEMAQRLAALGCTLFQGYLYSRPLPSENLLAFLKEKSKRNQR